MENLVCKLEMTVTKAEEGLIAEGNTEFHGTDLNKAMILSAVMNALEFPTEEMAAILVLTAFEHHRNKVKEHRGGNSAIDFVEGAKEWR